MCKQFFWLILGSASVSIWAGSIDGLTGLAIEYQIFTDNKRNYYKLLTVPIRKSGGLLGF